MYDKSRFKLLSKEIAALSQQIYAKDWVPATSGNFSARIDERLCAVTASGVHKGQLNEQDVLVVDFKGQVVDGSLRRPSAETALHTQLYARNLEIAAVLHTHDMNAVLASQLLAEHLSDRSPACIEIANMEMLKAFSGINTHESRVCIPVFENTQDIAALAIMVDNYMNANGPIPAYLIKGHGLYTWGRDLAEAMRHLEAMNYLLGLLLRLNGCRSSGKGLRS